MASAPYSTSSLDVITQICSDSVLAAEATLEQKNSSPAYSARIVSVDEKRRAIAQTMAIILGE